VVSEYRLGSPSPGGGFHELRRTLAVDGEPVTNSAPAIPIRHTLVAGAETLDDETKHNMLEELQFNKLQGAATDFGPLLLLFITARRGDTEFTFGGRETSPAGSAWVLRYRQTAPSGALTEFRNSRQLKHLPEGTIWLREGDLLPLRITLETEEYVTAKYRFRNEAEVEYRPTPFGLAPHLVVHRQLLNGELLVENRFSYSAWRGQEIIP
jgi:hypothetical protein